MPLRPINTARTSAMPPEVWHAFHEASAEHFVRDGFTPWHVDAFMADFRRDPDQFSGTDAARCAIVDQWLRSQGAAKGERVLIEHG